MSYLNDTLHLQITLSLTTFTLYVAK